MSSGEREDEDVESEELIQMEMGPGQTTWADRRVKVRQLVT